MKWDDFFCLIVSNKKPILMSVACCFVLTASAEPPPPEAFNQKSELILTLSNKWLESNANAYSAFYKRNRSKTKDLIPEESESKPANIGCGMDVGPNAGPNAGSGGSLSSRIIGECNFNYKY